MKKALNSKKFFLKKFHESCISPLRKTQDMVYCICVEEIRHKI